MAGAGNGGSGQGFSISEDVDGEAAKELTRSLVASNNKAGPREHWWGLVISLRDSDDKLIAGLSGHTHWSWLFIERLWVDERHRKTGIGKSLMDRAEEEALARGCRAAWVDTFDFQAEGFYLGLGYDRFGVLGDYPPGHERYFLWKPLGGQGGSWPEK